MLMRKEGLALKCKHKKNTEISKSGVSNVEVKTTVSIDSCSHTVLLILSAFFPQENKKVKYASPSESHQSM